MRLRRSAVRGPGIRRIRRGRDGASPPTFTPTTLNARFKELVGDQYTVKDLRTWHVTVLAATAFVDADPPVNKTVTKRVESAVMKEVAEELGNSLAVARSSYVDPRVVEGYESGLTIAAGVRRADRIKAPGERQAILENSTTRLIRKVTKS
jgi:DNA topoisomerase-1